jgi:hypothetical protein
VPSFSPSEHCCLFSPFLAISIIVWNVMCDLRIGIKGCVLPIAHGYQWTK